MSREGPRLGCPKGHAKFDGRKVHFGRDTIRKHAFDSWP